MKSFYLFGLLSLVCLANGTQEATLGGKNLTSDQEPIRVHTRPTIGTRGFLTQRSDLVQKVDSASVMAMVIQDQALSETPSVKLSRKQSQDLALLFNTDFENYQSLIRSMQKKMDELANSDQFETEKGAAKWKELRDVTVIAGDKYFDEAEARNRQISKMISAKQREAFRKLCIAEAYKIYDSPNAIILKGTTQKNVEWSLNRPEQEKIAKVIRNYKEELNALRSKTMEKILEELPPEMADATEYLMGVEGLRR